ncbi:hypothetical protein [Primorskyibacter sp. S187A]|uniref:hypothetical protein n=1 Tax=Primorskyibacter sp. S187A TaxID=3415130 RepID=UPI003C7B6B59
MMLDASFARSARNLFENCAECRPGDRVLLVYETEQDGYYDPQLSADLFTYAAQAGYRVENHGVPLSCDVRDPDAVLRAKMARADCTIFLARLGDQIRYRTQDASKTQIICYALDRAMFASPFGQVSYGAFDRLRGLINAAMARAARIEITCPLGTHMIGTRPRFPSEGADTTRKRFPVSIAAPVPAQGFSGRIVQSGFLTGTGSHYYTPYACGFDTPVTITFEGNRITGFDGAARDVEAARAHYRRVSESYGIDGNHVHSWHAGIHPGLRYGAFAGASTERWSGGAFGNPRILHIHTCGDYPPGEISLNVIDPTITLDGIPVWDSGRLYPERLAGGAALLDSAPDMAAIFANPARDIGLAHDGRLRLHGPAPASPTPRCEATLETA